MLESFGFGLSSSSALDLEPHSHQVANLVHSLTISTLVPQFPCSYTSASKLMSQRERKEEKDVSSLGLTADSCIFQLSKFVFETLGESE